MRKSFIRAWSEGFTPPMPVAPPEPVEMPSLNIPDMPVEPEVRPAGKPAGADDIDYGAIIGNLGAKIAGTLVDWTRPEGGFLSRVKNPEVLSTGIEKVWEAIQEFNRRASRLSSRSVTETKELREIQAPWLLTVGARLQALRSGDKSEKDKALIQLQLLAPKLEQKWNRFVDSNSLGVRVTNPEVITEPTGVPEEAPEPMEPETMAPELPAPPTATPTATPTPTPTAPPTMVRTAY